MSCHWFWHLQLLFRIISTLRLASLIPRESCGLARSSGVPRLFQCWGSTSNAARIFQAPKSDTRGARTHGCCISAWKETTDNPGRKAGLFVLRSSDSLAL